MNNVAVSPYYALHGLQLLNVKRNSVKISDAPTSTHTVNDETSHESIVQQNIENPTEQTTQQTTESGTTQINALPNTAPNANANANANTNATLSQSVDIVPYVPSQGVAATEI